MVPLDAMASGRLTGPFEAGLLHRRLCRSSGSRHATTRSGKVEKYYVAYAIFMDSPCRDLAEVQVPSEWEGIALGTCVNGNGYSRGIVYRDGRD